MKIVGILTEFNPFHNGHAWLFAQLRHRLGDDACIPVPDERSVCTAGQPAILRKHVRAEAALRCGADLVMELPLARALFGGRFARGLCT